MKTSSQYLSFARKYRPTNFADLLGQEVLVKTISYAVAHDRLCQGYILTGIRGVGKTTSARIIAKTVNCTELIKQHDQIKACENCKNCLEFKQQRHPDIIEIDAASRTGVDDIREIIESSEYRPLLGKYKIFIIDEVHMLSKSAFNALLKLLEEPPTHVIFIFATTEIQKVPLTVISRCQRYDLRRLTADELTSLLKKIAEQENIKYVEQALKIIAYKADGSARDATSLLDQATSYCLNLNQEAINSDLVDKMLGLTGTDVIINLMSFICEEQIAEALKLIDKLYQNSVNLENLIEDISDFTAYLTKNKLIDHLTEPLYQPFAAQISSILTKIDLTYLTIIWQIFSKGVGEVKSSHNQLIAVEMLIIKAIYAKFINNITENNEAKVAILPQTKLETEKTNFLQANIVTDVKQVRQDSLELKDKPTVKADEIVKGEKTNNSWSVTAFLKYLDQNKEREIYYFLLNEAEIKKFGQTEAVLELACLASNPKMQESLSSALFTWTGQKWNVNISRGAQITNLREQLVEKAKSSKEWNLIKQNFPSAELADILLTKQN